MKDFLKRFIIVVIFLVCVAVAFTMLPYINERITDAFGTTLINTETLDTLSVPSIYFIILSP